MRHKTKKPQQKHAQNCFCNRQTKQDMLLYFPKPKSILLLINKHIGFPYNQILRACSRYILIVTQKPLREDWFKKTSYNFHLHDHLVC